MTAPANPQHHVRRRSAALRRRIATVTVQPWIAAQPWAVVTVIAVLGLAALLRLWALDRPGQLVFDELYYVRDAVSQLAHGYPTAWPSRDVAFGGELARSFTDQAATVAHPPLGKWLIGLGMLLLGSDGAGIDSGWGWRIAAALAGVATVGLTMRLGWLISRSIWVACIAGLVLAVDGVHIVLSRVALLDGFLTLLVVLGAIFVWRDGGTVARLLREHDVAARVLRKHDTERATAAESAAPGPALGPILWRRPWLLGAGLVFGAAAAVKWSGLYPLAAFLLLITAQDLILRFRIARHPWLGALRQALVTAAIALPAALIAYLASWLGWILNPGGQDREPGEPWWVSLWHWHARTLEWHLSLTAEHPYQANPLGWPIGLRPTLMYWQSADTGPGCPWSHGCVATISSMPNPLVTWAGVVALALLLWAVARVLFHRTGLSTARAAAFVLVGYLAGWLPWVFTASRSAVFQFYTVVLTPFAALALALLLGSLCARDGGALMRAAGFRLSDARGAVQGRRIAVALFLIATVVVAVLFFPLWSGMPIAEWFWRAHIWLPGWR